MCAFDRAMNMLDEKFAFLSSHNQMVSCANDEDKVYILLSQKLLHMYIYILENMLSRTMKCVCVNKHYICA